MIDRLHGYLYAIRVVGTSHVKIGYSGNPASRLQVMQSGNSTLLELVCIARAHRRCERELQALIGARAHRIQGEWFDLGCLTNPDLVELFEGIDRWGIEPDRGEAATAASLLDRIAA